MGVQLLVIQFQEIQHSLLIFIDTVHTHAHTHYIHARQKQEDLSWASLIYIVSSGPERVPCENPFLRERKGEERGAVEGGGIGSPGTWGAGGCDLPRADPLQE